MADAGGQAVSEHINDDISEMLSAAACGIRALQRLLRRTRRPSYSGRGTHFAARFAVFLAAAVVRSQLGVLAALGFLASWARGFTLLSTGTGSGVR